MTRTWRPNPRRRTAIVLAALLAGIALLTAGCSLVRLFWGHLPDAMVARADDWLDLDSNGEQALRARLVPWLERARREAFPRYADFLRELANRTAAGFNAQDASWVEQRLDLLYAEAAETALDAWLVPTLRGLSPSQRRHLAKRLRARNAHYRDTYLRVSRHERARIIAGRIVREVERWTGKLDVHQVALVEHGTARLPDTAAAWYRDRLRMQATLLADLDATDAPSAALRRGLEAWLIDRRARDPESGAYREVFRARLSALLVRLARSLSARQRLDAARRFRELAGQLDQLAAAQPPAAADNETD